MGKILVTGSSGMIGTALVESLLKDRKECVCVDKYPNIFNKDINSQTIICDLSNINELDKIDSSRIDICVHLAANARVHHVVENPSLAIENINSTLNILEWCRRYGINNFIFASSREVYGDRDRECYEEFDVDVHHVLSNYTASKISGETFIRAYTNCYNMSHIIFRFSNVYGRYDINDRFVPICIARCLMEEDIIIFDVKKVMDFTYIDDTIDGIVSGINNFVTSKNEVFNLSYGVPAKLIDVAEFIKKELRSSSKIIYGKIRTGEISHYLGNCSKAKSLLRYSPKYSIQDGLKKTINWYTKYFSLYPEALKIFRECSYCKPQETTTLVVVEE